MKIGNDSKVGLATLVPLLLLIGAVGLFVAALVLNDGDVEKATVWATAVATGFFGLLTVVVRLVQVPRGGAPAAPAPSGEADQAVQPLTVSRDPLDPPSGTFDEVPAERTDALPPTAG